MAFTINTNIASMQAQEYLRATSDFQAKTINKVTSGLRIVNAGDDAAGLAIANFYRSDQAVLTQGVRNANDAMAKTLQDFVKQTVAPYKYPRAVEFVEKLPRTQTGKLQRFKLREPF